MDQRKGSVQSLSERPPLLLREPDSIRSSIDPARCIKAEKAEDTTLPRTSDLVQRRARTATPLGAPA